MPEEIQHLKKYSENKKLLDTNLNIENCDFYNWVVTVSFYAAVHLIEKDLASFNMHPQSHVDRSSCINMTENGRKVRSHYKTLLEKSHAARYSANSMNKQKAVQSLQLLEKIEQVLL